MFRDDYSRYCRTYFLKRKSEAFEKFKEFKASVETESGMKIKTIRADRGGEYLSVFLERVWNSATAHSSLLISVKWSIRTIEPYSSRSCQVYA